MNIIALKWLITTWLAVGAVLLAGWAAFAWWRGRPLGGGYAGLLRFLHLLLAVQLLLGLTLYARGGRPDIMHVVYGLGLTVTAAAQNLTAPQPGNPAGRGPVWALGLALVMLGLVARAWITGSR